MRRGRPGCLTGTGILAALVTALVIAGYAYARGGLMYNPGPLSTQGQAERTLGGVTSHAEMGGQCETCHVSPWGPETMADRCIACHTDIGEQMRDVATMHGTLIHNDPALACRHCHPEHRGAGASLTRMEDLSAFPHEELGFALTGHRRTAAGQPFQCSDCHPRELTTFALATCETCHRQIDVTFMNVHVTSFGEACLDCHDGVDRLGEKFDHDAFSFPLSGRHVNVACEQCHFNARGMGDFQATPQDCYFCHQKDDRHNGQFGAGCATCHNPSSWEDASFDHSLSGFPLTGAHADVPCEQCHTGGQYEGIASECAACHEEPESHAGRFGTDCAACHTTTAWSPAEFTGEHAFPLDHGDEVSSCATCHPTDFTTYTCYGCHEHSEADVREEHLEEGIANFQNCMECHPTGEEHEGDGRGDRD